MLKISLFITILFTLKQQLAALEATTPLQNSWNNLPQHLGLFASHTPVSFFGWSIDNRLQKSR